MNFFILRKGTDAYDFTKKKKIVYLIPFHKTEFSNSFCQRFFYPPFRSHKNPTFHQIWRSLLHSKWISRQNHFKLQEGVAGTFFEPHLWNSGTLLLFSRCTNHISITFWIIWLYKSCKKCWSLPLQVFRASWIEQHSLHIFQFFIAYFM